MSVSVDNGQSQLVCRFCGCPAVARYRLSAGCVCYPDDREQLLCAQHEHRCTPLGRMELLEDFRLVQEAIGCYEEGQVT